MISPIRGSLVHLLTFLLSLSLCPDFVKSLNDVWKELNLPGNNEMLEMMTAYQLQDYDEQTRELFSRSGSDTKQQQLGQRCGNRNECDEADDLQCTRAVLGRRCLPKNCLERGLKQFQQAIDMKEYKQNILQTAGVTEDQLLQDMKDAGSDRRSFLATNAFQAIKKAMDQNHAPADTLFQMYDQCVGNGINGTNPLQTSQRVNYQGLHLEGGALLDGALDFFWENASGDAFVRYCIGAAGLGGAEISFMYLIAQNTNDTEAITNTCHVRADVNFGTLLNLGVGYAYGLNNDLGQLELTAGLGVSFAGGVGFCGASRA